MKKLCWAILSQLTTALIVITAAVFVACMWIYIERSGPRVRDQAPRRVAVTILLVLRRIARFPVRLRTLTIVSLFIAGCASGRVYVVNSQGAPIQDAQVEPVSLSMNGGVTMTNERGEVSVPLNIGQDTKCISVSAPGFQPQQVDVPTKWPLKVVLQAATRP